MFRPLFVVLSLVSLSSTAFAAEPAPAPGDPPAPGEAVLVPVDLSLVPPISLNGDRAAKNHLSLGLGAARSGQLEGLALAPVHWTDGEVDGVQATWAAAVAGGRLRGGQFGFVTVAPEFTGLQASTLVALARDRGEGLQASGVAAVALEHLAGLQSAGVYAQARSVEGVQGAGVATYARGDVAGLQTAGLAAYAEGDLHGLQASGVVSLVRGDVHGLQASGVFNLARDVQGVQASTVNYADGVSGLQLAVVNIGRGVRGGQVGVINVADRADAQIGVFNYARSADTSFGLASWVDDGTHDLEFFATEFSVVNAGVRLGGRRIYGLLVGGVQPNERDAADEARWTFGAGVGGRVDLSDRFVLDVDLLAQNVQYGHPYDTDDGENVLASLRALAGFRVAPWLAAFAGPTVSLYTAKEKNRDIDLGSGLDVDLWGDARVWAGFAAGLRL